MKPMKLSPAMRRLVNALNQYGHIDHLRDLGRGTTSGTITALITRGILREQAPYRLGRVHFPTTTPEQVWADAHAEHNRRGAEAAAHAADPERWVGKVDNNGHEFHHRTGRNGQPVEVIRDGLCFWYVVVAGRIRSSAGGNYAEARAAADRAERNRDHDGVTDADQAEARHAAAGRAIIEQAAEVLGVDLNSTPRSATDLTNRELRELCNRFGAVPRGGLTHASRGDLLGLVEVNGLMRRAYGNPPRTRDDEQYPQLTADQAHPYALLEYAERDYLGGTFPFTAEIFDGILIKLADMLLTETERRMWGSDRHMKLWRQASICENCGCDRQANQHYGCGITAG